MNKQFILPMISVLFLFSSQTYSQKILPEHRGRQLTKSSGAPSATLVNINNISLWVRSDGMSAVDPLTGNAGTIFPRQTANIIYQDGLIWGGLAKDGLTPEIRVGGQTYGIGTAPGAIIAPGVAEDPSSPDVRIWRIRKDYATADLSLDAAELGLDVATVRYQYAIDWQEWPWQKSAPWIGVNNKLDGGYLGPNGVTILGAGNGILDRGEDFDSDGILDSGEDANGNGTLDGEFPGIAGADQIVWTVANDLDVARTMSLYGSPPIGLEMQLTLWGYNVNTPLKNVIFKRHRLIYKGTATTPANAVIDSMYICQWSDPDIGLAGDDLVGSDTTLSLGYAYNGGPTDSEFIRFGLTPPATGYDFFLGPIVPSPGDTAIFDFKDHPGFRNLPMTTFAFFTSGGIDYDPDRGGPYSGTLQWWNLLRGFRPRPESPPQPWQDPFGNVTKFLVPGDPVVGTGWIDSAPGDRRILLATGPFTMALGDTQEVVTGLIAGVGANHLLSISALKDVDRLAQAMFARRFALVLTSVDAAVTYESATQTRVWISAKAEQRATAMEATLIDSAGAIVESMALFDDGAHNDGNAGDGLFANELTVIPHRAPLDVNILVSTVNDAIAFAKVTRLTTAGPMEITKLTIVADHINDDRVINPGENIRVTASLRNGTSFDFDRITATFQYIGPLILQEELFQSFSNVESGTTVAGIYSPTDPSTFSVFEVRPEAQVGDTIRVNITLLDALGNRWQQQLRLQVKAFEFEPGDLIAIEHVSGQGDGDFFYRIVNSNLLKEHTYEIRIVEPANENELYGFDLIDVDEAKALLAGQPLPDQYSHHLSVTDGFKLFGANFATSPPITYRSAVQTVDADPNDAGLRLLGDARRLGGRTGLYNELGNGVPTPHVDILQRDIELRFTGLTDTGDWYGVVTAGGSWATQWENAAFGRANLSSLAHVAVQLPFEVWEVENNRQINCAVINDNFDGAAPYGEGVGDPNTPGMEPRWRITGRDFIIPIFTDYDPNATQSLNDSLSTWLLFFRPFEQSTWTTGDVFKIVFSNPLTNADRYRFVPVFTGVQEHDVTVREFRLFQNYPNPFNAATTIRYEVPKHTKITLEIYNMLGQRVKKLVDEKMAPGKYTAIWDGANEQGTPMATGVYFFRLKGGEFVRIKKLILLR